jgi:hypothetical protein
MNKMIQTFKGGSLSATMLMRHSNGNLFVRKNVSIIKNREYGFQRWYSQLKRIQRYSVLFPGIFPKLLDYGKDEATAFMDLEYLNNAINAQEFIDKSINFNEIDRFFNALIENMDFMYQEKMVSSSNGIQLYINEEVDQRLKDCMQDEEFQEFMKHESIIFNGVEVRPFIDSKKVYKDLCIEYFQNPVEVFTHGNLTLENILYDPTKGRVIFIDPYEENIIDSELAEYSQLLQSSNGKYELYNSKHAKIDGNKINARIDNSPGIDYFNNMLTEYLKESFTDRDYVMIRLFEVSQFIRMLPFKLVVDKNKLFLFYGLASYLFEQLRRELKV